MANEKDNQAPTRESAGRGRAVEEVTKAAEPARVREAAEPPAPKAANATPVSGPQRGRDAAENAGDAARHSAEKGVEATRRGAEALRETTRDASNAAFGVASQTTDQFQRMFGLNRRTQDDVARQAQSSMEAVVECNSVLMDGFQSVWKEWLSLSQDALRRQYDGVGTMMRSRTIQDLYAAQNDLIRDELALWLDRTGKISELSARTAGDAARRLHETYASSRHGRSGD